MTIPVERIERLEQMAADAVDTGKFDRSRSYVRLARRIAERHRVPFPRSFERHTCDQCDVYLRTGHNARTRLQDGHVVVTCTACGAHSRYGYE